LENISPTPRRRSNTCSWSRPWAGDSSIEANRLSVAALGRLETITTAEVDGVTPDDQIDLAYDAADNLIAAADNDSELAFTYDGLNRPPTLWSGSRRWP